LGSAKPYYPRDHPQTYVFEENLKDTTGLFIDETRDTLHTTTTSEAANGGFCDTLDVIAKDFAMTLSTTLAKALKHTQSHHDQITSLYDESKVALPFHLFRGQTCSESYSKRGIGESELSGKQHGVWVWVGVTQRQKGVGRFK